MLRQGPLRAGAATAPFVDLQLPRAASLSGAVQPWVAGRVAVVVAVHQDGPVRRSPVDATTGHYMLTGLTPGRTWVYVERGEPNWRSRISRQLFDKASTTSVRLDPGGEHDLDPQDPVASMAILHGAVTGSANPMDLVVRAFRESAPLPERAAGLYRATPAQDGLFTIDGLLPGRWRLQVELGAEVLQWRVIEVTAGAELRETLAVGR